MTNPFNTSSQTIGAPRVQAGSLISACYVVPGLPHVLLAPEKSPGWQSLHDSFALIRREIEASDAEMILYFSSQWLTVLGYLFQADPEPEWSLVDHNWHEFDELKETKEEATVRNTIEEFLFLIKMTKLPW